MLEGHYAHTKASAPWLVPTGLAARVKVRYWLGAAFGDRSRIADLHRTSIYPPAAFGKYTGTAAPSQEETFPARRDRFSGCFTAWVDERALPPITGHSMVGYFRRQDALRAGGDERVLPAIRPFADR